MIKIDVAYIYGSYRKIKAKVSLFGQLYISDVKRGQGQDYEVETEAEAKNNCEKSTK